MNQLSSSAPQQSLDSYILLDENDYAKGLKRKRDKFEQIKSYLEEKSYKILCYDKQHNIVSEFDSLADASRWVGKSRNVSSDIREVCVGKQLTAFGYIWKKIKSE